MTPLFPPSLDVSLQIALAVVGSIDDLQFKVGPETVSAKLKAGFANYARASADAHPELKV